MKAIPLTNMHYFALVDDEDYERVAKYNWYGHKIGGVIYAKSSRFGGVDCIVLLHRYIMRVPKEVHIDHKNRFGLDCRKHNMRPCTQRQNNCNAVMPQGPRGSGYRGVIRNHKRWSARIKIDGKLKHLGTYDTVEEAARIYDAAAIKHHGDFATLNFDV